MSGTHDPEERAHGRQEPQLHRRAARPLQHIHDNDEQALDDLIAIRVLLAVDASDLDAKMFATVDIAALIATGGDDASYLLHVTAALDAGASVDEITGVLTAVGPNVGVFKMVAAADPPAAALGVASRRWCAQRATAATAAAIDRALAGTGVPAT